MRDSLPVLLIILFILVTALLVFIIYLVVSNLTYYPHQTITIDITRKRKMDNNDLLDYYIINNGTMTIDEHVQNIADWKKDKILSYGQKQKKIDKFNNRCLKNAHKAFTFIGYREQTRYRQVNYERFPYIVKVNTNNFDLTESFVVERIAFLKEHDFLVTLNGYKRADQRKAMTRELRDEIKDRDDYTCQECGKHMPDEVGLHIDHIIPIARGGKSIPNNLRVLCSKCNGRKRDS